MLADPTTTQREVLSAMPYSSNTAQLHTDTSVLPRATRARASWNYLRRPSDDSRTVTVSYDMTRLMRLPVPTDGRRFIVTLGGQDIVDQGSVIETMEYQHPIYTPASVAAQRRLPECDTDRVVFAGAWHGWGFHEDGARSGVEAAGKLGVEWGSSPPGCPVEPTSYATTIRHTRRKPFKRTFEHRSRTWLVDLDHLPDHGILGRFEARDHLGDPDSTLKANVENFLAVNGVETDGGRILMAANARALGHCFNPISVFWCHRRNGELAGVVVEVHNTYGDRHAYLVHPDEQGRARTAEADVRLAVPRHRRPLRDRRAAARREAARLGDAAQRRRSGVQRLARRRAHDQPPRFAAPPRRCAAPCSSTPTASGCGPDGSGSAHVPTTRDRKASDDDHPHAPGHRLARTRHHPLRPQDRGLRQDRAPALPRRRLPAARHRPRGQRLHPHVGHAADRRCGSSDPRSSTPGSAATA